MSAVEKFKTDIDVIFKQEVGCDWNELAGDEEPLEQAVKDGTTPREFVEDFIEKFDLTKLHKFWP